MRPISFARHRFPPEVIRQAVWLYFRFTLSFRDVEDLMAARGIEVSYEAIRCWTLKFGTLFARNLRRARPGPTTPGCLLSTAPKGTCFAEAVCYFSIFNKRSFHQTVICV